MKSWWNKRALTNKRTADKVGETSRIATRVLVRIIKNQLRR